MKRGRKRKKQLHISKKILLSLLFSTTFIVVLEMVLLFLPVTKAQGQDLPKKTLGEDSLLTCSTSDVITHGSRDKKDIALTFDADMTYEMDHLLHTGEVTSYINHDLINTLINTQTPATLFLTGLWMQDYPEDTRLLAQNPLFQLGNHSYSHPTFEGYCYGLPQLGTLSMEQEIDVTQQLLKTYTGIDNKYFRFPGGCVSPEAMNYLRSEGIQTVHWDVVGDDGFNEDTDSIIANVLDRVQNGSIIVLHMNGYPNDPKTSEALPVIIKTLKERGYTFVKISDLLK